MSQSTKAAISEYIGVVIFIILFGCLVAVGLNGDVRCINDDRGEVIRVASVLVTQYEVMLASP